MQWDTVFKAFEIFFDKSEINPIIKSRFSNKFIYSTPRNKENSVVFKQYALQVPG